MKRLIWLGACAAILAGALFVSGTAAQARGALAIGDCGAWGGSWNYDNDDDARARARSECKGRNYTSEKSRRNDPQWMELKKYCPNCRKHTLHRETK